MLRLCGLAVLLAAAWLSYRLAMEFFIAWYSGSSPQLDRKAAITGAIQLAVNLAACWFGLALALG